MTLLPPLLQLESPQDAALLLALPLALPLAHASPQDPMPLDPLLSKISSTLPTATRQLPPNLPEHPPGHQPGDPPEDQQGDPQGLLQLTLTERYGYIDSIV